MECWAALGRRVAITETTRVASFYQIHPFLAPSTGWILQQNDGCSRRSVDCGLSAGHRDNVIWVSALGDGDACPLLPKGAPVKGTIR